MVGQGDLCRDTGRGRGAERVLDRLVEGFGAGGRAAAERGDDHDRGHRRDAEECDRKHGETTMRYTTKDPHPAPSAEYRFW